MKKSETQRITGLVLKAVAVGMSNVRLVIGFIPGAADVETHIALPALGWLPWR